MTAVRKWQGPATLASAVALLCGAGALVPSASLAATHQCGSKKITFERPAEDGSPATKFKLETADISTQGVSCQAAYTFLTKLYSSSSGGTPEKYKCVVGHFKAPVGKVPEVCTRPGKKIQWAGQGG